MITLAVHIEPEVLTLCPITKLTLSRELLKVATFTPEVQVRRDCLVCRPCFKQITHLTQTRKISLLIATGLAWLFNCYQYLKIDSR